MISYREIRKNFELQKLSCFKSSNFQFSRKIAMNYSRCWQRFLLEIVEEQLNKNTKNNT